ncbi:major facilitator superfamily domain-containing protein [Gymnopilus junonius]|uniref:Major facilitator superfamily domain-containing protein n=1 Tax=Gymnopilus junonius TaxID=109634 RepID=A0A9P5NG67_GYMJU|nr:major facilitator superfamily domain-containing protein [Gymnopilus junonius]
MSIENQETIAPSYAESEKKVQVQSYTKESDPPRPSHPPFPEGGFQAWATAFGAFLIQFCGFGYTTSFGVFQDYYVRVHLPEESASTISWIGSINAFLVIAGGLLAGRLCSSMGGSILISFSLFMLSLTKPDHYYQVLLAQGFGVGVGTGMIYVPSVAVLSHYFHRRRSSVMTFVAAGSSLGAVIHPIMLNNTLDKIGFPTATRANAGLISGLLLIACLSMRTRLPPPAVTPNLKKALIKFSKDKAYVCCAFGFLFFITGLYYPLFYIQLDAIKHGLNPSFSFYSLVILNGSSFFGRIASGFLAGAVGVGNLVIAATFCCSILIFSMIAISSIASVVIIAILIGFFSGVYIALMAPMVANLADDFSEIGLRMGIGFMLAGVGGLIGTPIEGALLTSNYHWWRAEVFTGVMALTGCACYSAMVFFLHQKQRRKQEYIERE